MIQHLETGRLLLTCQPSNIADLSQFDDSTRLFYSNEEVGTYNHEQLIKLQQPVANIMLFIHLL